MVHIRQQMLNASEGEASLFYALDLAWDANASFHAQAFMRLHRCPFRANHGAQMVEGAC